MQPGFVTRVPPLRLDHRALHKVFHGAGHCEFISHQREESKGGVKMRAIRSQ